MKRPSIRQVLHVSVFILAFTYSYIGPVAFACYFLILASLSLRLRFIAKDWVSIILLTAALSIAILQYDVIGVVMSYRYHFGFFLFYLLYRYIPIQINFNKIFFLLAVLIILEGLLVNSFIQAENMPNYPNPTVFIDGIESNSPHFSGNFQRTYSFGGNATVTSVLMVVMFSLIPFSLAHITTMLVVILTVSSGVGVFAFIVSMLRHRPLFIMYFVVICILSYIGFVYLDVSHPLFHKLSPEYIEHVFDIKFSRIDRVIHGKGESWIAFGSINDFIMGHPLRSGRRGGDFSLLNFFYSHGLFGIVIMLSIILPNIKRSNYFPVLLIVVATLHYHVFFSMSGQLLMGYLLASANKTFGNSK